MEVSALATEVGLSTAAVGSVSLYELLGIVPSTTCAILLLNKKSEEYSVTHHTSTHMGR